MADPILVGTGVKYVHKFDPAQVFTVLYFEGGNFNYMVKRFNLEGCPMTTEFSLISDHKDSQMIEFFATEDARQLMEYQVGREVQKEELDLTEVADIKSYKALGSKFTAKNSRPALNSADVIQRFRECKYKKPAVQTAGFRFKYNGSGLVPENYRP